MASASSSEWTTRRGDPQAAQRSFTGASLNSEQSRHNAAMDPQAVRNRSIILPTSAGARCKRTPRSLYSRERAPGLRRPPGPGNLERGAFTSAARPARIAQAGDAATNRDIQPGRSTGRYSLKEITRTVFAVSSWRGDSYERGHHSTGNGRVLRNLLADLRGLRRRGVGCRL